MGILGKWEELTEELRNLAFRRLGPLSHLIGFWEGTGYTSVFRPNGQDNTPFVFQQNKTKETLLFIPLLMSVPDRGALSNPGQRDIFLRGIIYEQVICDEHDITNVLHLETGQWLYIPKTTVPEKNETVARQASILHGVSFTATGDAPLLAPVMGGPSIISANTKPIGPQVDDPGYLEKFNNAPLISGMPAGSIQDPSVILRHRIETQKIIETVTFEVSAQLKQADSPDHICGIANIPFVDKNSQVTNLKAAFYVEHIDDGRGGSFMQLQYVQIVPLSFDNIIWPHVSVATLRRAHL